MKWNWLLFLFMIFFACKSKNDRDKFITAFENQETKRLKSQSVELEKTDFLFSSMFDMLVIDSLIFINEIKDPEYEMKILNLRTKKLQNFGKRGRGPNEIRSRGVNFSADYNNKKIFVIDRDNCLVYSTDSIKNNNLMPEKNLYVDIKNNEFLQSTISNGKLVGNSMEGKPFGIYDIETQNIMKKESPNSDLLPKGNLNNQLFFVNHPTKSLVAYFYYKSGVNGVISINNKSVNIHENLYWVTNNREIKSGNKINIEHMDDEINGFIDASADSQYIYALYSGKNMDVSSIDELTKTYLTKYIYVFDWKGNPVKRYELDQEVRSIAKDINNEVLYAASYEGEPHLIKYNLDQ